MPSPEKFRETLDDFKIGQNKNEDNDEYYFEKMFHREKSLLIIFIDKVYHDFHHCVLLLHTALGYHQCKGDECVVSDTLMAVFGIKYSVLT